jgi:hypothetical protein
LNEVVPVNTSGANDNAGEPEPWIELVNMGSNPVSLAGCCLSDSYASLAQWAFPPDAVINPGQYLVVWADGEPGESTASELHTGFRLTNGTGSVVLSRIITEGPQVLDYLNFQALPPDWSFGAIPDGQPFQRQVMFYATPGGTNNPAAPPVTVFVNEWMADNTGVLADPADGDFEDWFELYNAGLNAVNLEGFHLTDDLADMFQFRIPAGYTVPPRGYLLVWADGEPGQNDTNRADLHVNFRLDRAGEAIGLFANDSTLIDSVTFGPQTADVSEGRLPDGSATIVSMTNYSPRAANFLPQANTPPVFLPVADQVINGGRLLVFTVAAMDTNLPPQTLAYSLDERAPAGASIHPASGEFRWQPDPVFVPVTNQIIVRVTDDGSPRLSATTTVAVIVIPMPRVGGARIAGNLVALLWETHPGRTYRLQFTDDLATGSWTNLGSPVTATDGCLTFTEEIQPSGQRFYRVVQVD